jgi:excisionase family DNA binding protein
MEATPMDPNKPPMAVEPLWDVKATARYLNTSPSWTYKAVERGDLPAVRLGSMLRFRPEDVRDYVTARARSR